VSASFNQHVDVALLVLLVLVTSPPAVAAVAVECTGSFSKRLNF